MANQGGNGTGYDLAGFFAAAFGGNVVGEGYSWENIKYEPGKHGPEIVKWAKGFTQRPWRCPDCRNTCLNNNKLRIEIDGEEVNPVIETGFPVVYAGKVDGKEAYKILPVCEFFDNKRIKENFRRNFPEVELVG